MGKTITTYLIDGDPQGTQYVFISNKICKMLVVPRSKLTVVNEREELQSPAFYILLGDDKMEPEAYVGETENFKERVRDHHQKKDFWQKALVFVSKDGAMTKADVQYLEHLAVKLAREAKRFSLDSNKQLPKAPNLPEHQRDSMDEFFDDIRFLTSFIGCPIFEVVNTNNQHIFQLNSRQAKASGFYDGAGFTVLKGSVIDPSTTPSFSWKAKREGLILECTKEQGGQHRLEFDKTFSSPSTAADFCNGRHNNGWKEWKDKDGNTLDSIYRVGV